MSRLAIDGMIERCLGAGARNVALLVGSEVDRRLASEGAMALALNESTVLVASSLEQASPRVQRLVIAHELAHTIQLSRHGSDAGEELEAEAWEAAWSAVRGIPFTIRGSASRPLAAKAVIAMGGALDAAANAHYTQFRAERQVAAGAIEVTSPTIVKAVNWDSVLDEIIAGMSGNTDKSFVLCAHGNKDGMTMPVVAGSAFVANTTTLEFLMTPTATTTTVKAVAGKAPPSSTQIASLVSKMNSVRKLGIVNVEFRGCSMGSDYKNLEVLRAFLGATSVSAPDVKSSWVITKPNILSSADFTTWKTKTSGVQVWTYSTGRCGFKVDWGSHTSWFAADSTAAIPYWLKDHFFKLPAFAAAPAYEAWMGNFGLHGLHLTPVALPMDAAYATHIKRVTMTGSGIVRT